MSEVMKEVERLAAARKQVEQLTALLQKLLEELRLKDEEIRILEERLMEKDSALSEKQQKIELKCHCQRRLEDLSVDLVNQYESSEIHQRHEIPKISHRINQWGLTREQFKYKTQRQKKSKSTHQMYTLSTVLRNRLVHRV